MEAALEEILNPPPKKYRVSMLAKHIFMVFLLCGTAFYVYMIVDRRLSQQRYLVENEMAAIKLSQHMAPEFLMMDPQNGKQFALSQFKGQWVLLNLWATWCPSCQAEMPSLDALEKKLGDKLTIIALSVDDKIDPIINYVATNKPSFKIYYDFTKVAARLFSTTKYPETFLISPEGKMITQFSGERDWSSGASLQYFKKVLNIH